MLPFWHGRLPQFTQITDKLGTTSWGQSSGMSQESSAPSPDIPEEWNAEALPRVLAWQQHALPAGEFCPVPHVLLALHGGKARPQEDGMLAILGGQLVDAFIDAAHPLGPQRLPEEIELEYVRDACDFSLLG